MPKYASCEPGIERERPFERFLDAFAVARGGEALAAQHPPLRPRPVGAAQIEPCLRRAAARAWSMRPSAAIAAIDLRLERRIDAPGSPGRAESATTGRRRRATLAGFGRRGRAGPRQDGAARRRSARRGWRRRRGAAAPRPVRPVGSAQAGARQARRPTRGRRTATIAQATPAARVTAHVMLVRSCCFSACRSRASAISRSTSSRVARRPRPPTSSGTC